MGQKKLPMLAQVLQRLVLLRLFLPLLALSVLAIGGVGYFGERNLESQQRQTAQALARIVDRYLEQAARTLDTVARVAEVSPPADLVTFLQGTWEAYGHFDTLYYLDESSKITLLAPPDPRYLGLDMSNLGYFQRTEEKRKLIISRPFISLRTGNPTVYLIRPLAQGGQVVGELSLGSLQDEITRGKGTPGQDVIFIMDQSGLLVAHPSPALVKQQTNQSHLEIFRRGLSGDTTLVYEYGGTMVLGSTARVEQAGWVVVNQIPLSASLSPYVSALGLMLLASLVIWLALVWYLRGQLQQHVVTPLVQLSRGIGALASGDFSQGKALAVMPAAFAELTTLATDFQQMSNALQARQVALQESEERYRLVFENSPVSIWEEDFSGVRRLFDNLRKEGITDLETYFTQHPETVRQCANLIRIVDVNQAALTLHKAATKKELLASLINTFTPESFDTLRQELVCLWNGETEMISDAVARTLVGEPRHVTVHFSVSPGYEETLSKVLVSLTDITERKQTEQALRDSEERLKQIASSLRDVIWLRDIQTRQVLYVNPAFEKLTGRTCQSFYENRDLVKKAIHPDDKAWVIQALDQRSERAHFNQEHRIIHVDGSVRWVSSRSFPVRNEAGEIYRWVTIMENITERKQAEEQVHRLNQELEQRVLDRTAQLEAANKELEAFAYSVSHDLRAPLRHIDGFLELLQQRIDGALDERSRHYMATISDSAKRMGQLIDDLLAFSRMGRYELSKTPVDLGLLVQEIIQDFAPEMEDRMINWGIAPLTIVYGDRAMLRLVLTNLIANALKFTRGRALAEIAIGCQTGHQETITFVRDNGVGFDMAYADKLFGVFQRLHHVEEFEGTGIGLASVRRIVHRHGGRTWAEAKINKGATFYFSLPSSAEI